MSGDGGKIITRMTVTQVPGNRERAFQAPARREGAYRLFFVAAHIGCAAVEKDFDMAVKRARDAVNGRFITLEEASRRPRETVLEKVDKPRPRKRKSVD